MIFGGTQNVQPRAHCVYRQLFLAVQQKIQTVHRMYCLKISEKTPRAAPIQGLRGFLINGVLSARRYTECAHLYIAIPGAFLKGAFTRVLGAAITTTKTEQSQKVC